MTPAARDVTAAERRRIHAAAGRLAEMGRLEFVLALVNRAPEEMLEGARLDHRDMIRAFVGTIGSLAADPLPLETLERIRQRVGGGLSLLFREGVPQGWNLEETVSLTVAPAPDLEPLAFDTREYGYRLPWPLKLQYRLKTPTIEALFVLGAATEIAARWEEIRKCRWCEAFFVKTTSQRFCSRQCTQALVNSRRAGRTRKPPFVVPAKQQAEQQKVIDRARKAGEQHRAGLSHATTVCSLCAAESEVEASKRSTQ